MYISLYKLKPKPIRALEAMLTVADDETDYVVAGVEKFGDVPTEVILQPTSGKSREPLESVLCPAPWAQLFRRDIIADSGLTFREDLSYSEDTLFVYTYPPHPAVGHRSGSGLSLSHQCSLCLFLAKPDEARHPPHDSGQRLPTDDRAANRPPGYQDAHFCAQ